MNRKSWLEMFGRGASVVLIFLFTIAAIAIGASALSAQTPLGGGIVVKPVSPPAFLVAPSLPLGYSPTSLAAGALTSSGRTDLVTADSVAGRITVFTGQGHGTFAAGVSYAAGAQPTSLLIADVDGDGRADVVLANPSEGLISVFPGNGDGTLGARKTYAVGFAPSFLAVGDFTGNGRLDIAAAGAAGKSLAIFQNAGAGSLNRPVNFSLNSPAAAMVAADFNHDGHIDLAIAGALGTVSVFLGKGNGQFSVLPDISVAAGALSSLAVGDFNRDGNPDLVITSAALNQAAVLLGTGDGRFAPATLLAVGSSPVATHIADVDGDGIPDLIVVNKGSNTFSVLNGIGDGTFKTAAQFVVGNAPLGAVAADFYGNGRADLATINQLGRNLSVPSGNGDGTFAAGRAYVAGAQPVAVASGDLTRSGRSDMVVANYCPTDATCGGNGSVAILLAGPGGVYQLGSTYPMGAGSVGIRLVDVNGDGILDMLALNRVDRTLAVRLGAGDGTFGTLNTTALAGAPLALAGGSFTKAGSADLAILEDCGSAACTTAGHVEMLLGLGNGNFRSAGVYTVGYSPVALTAGVIRTGATADVIVANRCGSDSTCKSGGTATVLFGNGSGSFSAAPDLALGNSPSSIALANLRGTGILDLVISRSTDNTVAVLPGTGAGTFKAAVPYAVGAAPGALTIADFNGDGTPDVAVANTADSTVSVLFGKSNGTLQTAFAVPVSNNPTGLAAIAGANASAPASLASINGSMASPLASSNVTVVSNLTARPMAGAGGGTTANTTTLALTSGSNPSTVNQSLTFTATVTGVGGSGNPTGKVVFSSNAVALADCGGATGLTVTAGPGVTATATCTTSSFTASGTSYALTAQYLGDTVYDVSTSSTVNHTVNAAAPTVGVTPAPASPSPFNTSVTFTAALSGTLTPVVPNGTMTFALDGTTVASCTATVQTNGTASCAMNNIPVGAAHSITATYSGDTNFVPAAAGSASYTITKASPTLVVTSSPASPGVNAAITLTATLTGVFTPTAPNGTISFSDGGTGIGTCATQAISPSGANYVATCIISDLAAGAHSITGVYTGDTNFNTATSAALPLTIGKAATTLTVAAPAPTAVNTNATFTATLHGTFTPTAPTTGSAVTSTVDFIADAGTANQLTLCSGVQLTAVTFTAACTTNVLNGSAHNISATYSGDTNFASSSTTTSASYTPTKAATTLTIAAPAAGPVNSNATFTATLHGTFTPVLPTTASAATSTVAFYADGSATPITGCSASQLQAGTYTATCTTNTLSAAAHAISATYSGDTSFATSSTTASASYTPTKLTGTLALASSVASPTTVGTTVTFTVTYTVTPVTPLAPSGNISFTINGAADPMCPAVAINASQQATCVTNALTAGNYQIAASYAGDTNFNTATASSFHLSVNKAAPTVGLTAVSTTTPAVVNEPVTYTAVVPTPGPGTQTVLPTGTVRFTQGATTLCANAGLDTSNPPQAVCTYSAPSPVTAPGTVTATYSGDSNFTAGTAGTATGTVTAASTTTTIVSSGTVNVGQAVTYTITVGPQFAAPPSYPQGTVTFTTNASPAATGTCTTPLTLSSTGTVANCTLTFSTGGPFNVSAQFASSNGNFSNSTSNTVIQGVNSGALGINLTSSASPTSVNQPVTFSAAFTPANPSPTPNGSVTYTDGATTLCTFASITAGTIPNCTYTFTSAGSHAILANFSPSNSAYTAASSNTLSQVVSKNLVGTAVSASLSSASVNQQVTFTATLSPATFTGATGTLATPGGTVTFNASSTAGTISPCSNVAIVNNAGVLTAQCATTFATIGTYTVAAQYSGDTNFAQGAAASTQVAVGTANTAVSVTPPSGVTLYVNEAAGVTFTASVTPTPTGSVSPTGSMTFTDSVAGTSLCIPQTVASDGHGGATASCSLIFRSAGAHTITATYGGDTNFPTASNTAAVTVNATHMSISTSSGGTVPANQAVTYTTTLTPQFAGSGATLPKGTVTFASSPATTLTGTCMPNVALTLDIANLVPTCTLIFPSAGNYTITATFNPSDTNFATNTSAGVSQVISKAPSGLVVPVPAPVVTNQASTLTAAFTPAITGTQPTGTATYYDGAAAIANCTVTLASGVIPPCTTHFKTAGAHNITAVYAGDANFNTETSSAVTQTVNPAPTTAVVTSSTGTGATAASAVNQAVTFTATVTPQFADSALASPTGTVAFYDNNNLAAPICQGVSLTAQANGTATATCGYTFTTTGTNTISAAYSGDSNFVAVPQLNSTPVTQTVNAPNTTLAVTPPLSAAVNQTVTFSIRVTPNSKGQTVPTGKVTFSDIDPTTIVCAPPSLVGDNSGGANSGTSSASCNITFLKAGPHTITATYAGDLNFAAPSPQGANVNVSPSDTAVTLGSSSIVSFATQTVTYTAKVIPTPTAGANLAVPAGTVTFSSTDGTVDAICKTPVAVLPNGDGTASAQCTANFPHLPAPAGSVNVSAIYNDPATSGNFNTSSTALNQIVQDFNVSLAVTPLTGSVSLPTAIYVAPGYGTVQNGSIKADPWGAAAIASSYTLSNGYLNGDTNIAITCSVYATNAPDLTKPPLQDPSCTTLKKNTGQWQFAVNVGKNVPTGAYTVYFTTYDTRYNNLSLTLPASVLLYVVGQSPTLSLGAGSQGTQNLTFNTALANGGDTINTFACGQIIDSSGAVVPNTNLISCSGAAGQTVGGDSTSLPVTISTASTTAQLAHSSSTLYAAAILGLPVMALLGWFGTKRSPRRTLYRFLSMIVLLVGLSFATGCGGSFHASPPPVQKGIQPGSYQVQVIATGSGATPKQYYAVVPLQVNAIQ